MLRNTVQRPSLLKPLRLHAPASAAGAEAVQGDLLWGEVRAPRGPRRESKPTARPREKPYLGCLFFLFRAPRSHFWNFSPGLMKKPFIWK